MLGSGNGIPIEHISPQFIDCEMLGHQSFHDLHRRFYFFFGLIEKAIHKIQVDGVDTMLSAVVEDVGHSVYMPVISVVISQKGTTRTLQSERDSAEDFRMVANDGYLTLVNRVKRRFDAALEVFRPFEASRLFGRHFDQLCEVFSA